MSVFSARLAAKRLGKVSENRFSIVQKLLGSPAAVQLWTSNGNRAKIFVYAQFLTEIPNSLSWLQLAAGQLRVEGRFTLFERLP
jgi:hypothetical protein